MIFADQRAEHVAGVLQAVIKIHDLHTVLEILLAQILQPLRSVNEHHHLASTGHATPDRFLAQARAKFIAGFETRYIGGGFPVANWMALVVSTVLSEHT